MSIPLILCRFGQDNLKLVRRDVRVAVHTAGGVAGPRVTTSAGLALVGYHTNG